MDQKTNEMMDKFLESKNIQNEEELKKAIEEFVRLQNSGGFDDMPDSPMVKAYDLLDKAQYSKTKADAKKYTKKALEICPECIDAEMFLAELESDFFKAEKIMLNAISIEKERLKKEKYFDKDNIGHFYGIYETRGYIRALYQLAHKYAIDGRIKKSIELCEEILRLNENDNTGSRYLLMGLYAYLEDEKSLKDIYQKYDFECLEALIPFMILYYKKGDYITSKKYLTKINKHNEYFKDIFIGSTIVDGRKAPEGYYSVGDTSEVEMYLDKYEFLLNSVRYLEEFVTKDGNIK